MRKINWLNLYHSILLGCLSFITIEAQHVVLPVDQLTVAENLSAQTYNYFVFKDSEGFVWISSMNGLNRYDGQEVIQYHSDEAKPNSISDIIIYGRFYEDKYTNVWFGTGNAIHCYDRLNDQFFKYQIKKDSVLLKEYRLLHIDHKKEELLVAASDNGESNKLYRFSVNEPDSFTYILEYFMSIGVEVVEDIDAKSRTLYAPMKEGAGLAKLVVKDEIENANIVIDTLLQGNNVEDIFYENDQNIWCIGTNGLYKMNTDGKILAKADAFEGTALTTMNNVSPYDKDQLLIGTRNEGLYLVDRETVQITDKIYSSKDGKVQPFNSMVDFISVDKDGTFWISTDGQGVYYLTPSHKKMNAYLQSNNGDFFGRSNIQDITEDQDDLLWCLTKDGIVVINSFGDFVPEYEYLTENPPSFLEDYVYSIFSDDNNQIFVCGGNGLFTLSKKKESFEQVEPIDASFSGQIISGLPCRNKTVLVNGLLSFGDSIINLFKLINTVDGPRLKSVFCKVATSDISIMFEDSKQKVYLCRDREGILIGNESAGEFLVDTFFAKNLIIYGLVEDTLSHSIWLAAQTGLYQIKKDSTAYTLSKKENFDLTNLNGILFDEATGYLWISNNNGLHAFHPDSSSYRSFTLKEGLQAREFNLWSALETRSGLFAFGGTNGINLFDPKEAMKLSAKIPVPKITRILIDYRPDSSLVCNNTGARNVTKFESLKLEYEKNTIAFNFAALDYRDPSANKFKFQMEEVDEDWVFSGKTNSARYPNLEIGKYKFMIKASSAEGIWSDDPAYITTLEIEILAPWYRTNLAYFIYTLLVSALLFRAYQRRINRIRQEEEFKRKEAEFKQKEAEYKQLAAETETAVLRLQMNPHFIFNSMNSISSYILERDVDTANAYLDRFAKLMRMILKLGKQPIIPVADEIDLLEQYMKTEAMRFEQKFDYDFDLGPNVDEDDTFVPTMILQPFVENAIWHGLSGKTNKGHIKIRFWQDTISLFCSIEDDGIGREASKKKKSLSAHKSKALEITRRRLSLLGEKEGKKADFTFEDVLNEAGQIAGTRVLLQIPLL